MSRPIESHDELKRRLTEYFGQRLNVQIKNKSLKLVGIEFAPNGKGTAILRQKKSKSLGVNYSNKVRAKLELKESGKVIDRATVTLCELPEVTSRGTYIVKGSEYSFPIQKRLLPGVYVRSQNDGGYSAWFNTGEGQSFKLVMKPSEDDIQVSLGGKHVNLRALLVGMGVKDEVIRKALGQESFLAQLSGRGSRQEAKAVETFYQFLRHESDEAAEKGLEGRVKWIRAYFNDRESFDPGNMQRLMDQETSKFSPALMLKAAVRLLEVKRGDKDEHDTDSLDHAAFFDVSDFVIERLNSRMIKAKITRGINRNLLKAKKVSEVVGKTMFQGGIESTFTQTSLARVPKQNNPMDVMSSHTEITSRGEGGISNDHAVSRSTRALNPSHMGYLDPVHTPEGSNIGTTLHLAVGVTKKGRDLVRKVMDVKSKKVVEIDHRKFYASTVAFSEFWDHAKNKLKGTKIKASRKGKIVIVPPGEVDYALRRATDLFGVNTLGAPFMSHNNGTRGMTAAKMQAQAKPLKYREEPLVQAAIHENTEETIEEVMGKGSLPRSPVDGVVKSVERDEVVIQGGDGKSHSVEVPYKFWMNESNYDSVELSVKKGDKVKKGQVLGESNYTKGGKLALGVNLRTAYIPYKGYNHEDGVVISEEGAKMLTSLHAHQKTVSMSEGEILDKKKYVAQFPMIYGQDTLKKLDDKGVIKVGEVIERGEPMVVKMRRIEQDTVSKKLASISRSLMSDFRDASVEWEKSEPATVEEVTYRGDEVLIVLSTEEKAKVGDKTVGRYGNKGTITKIVPNDEMPRNENGEVMHLLMNPDTVPGRMNLGQVMETTASKIALKDGKPFVAKPFGTDNRSKILSELKKRGLKDSGFLMDPESGQKIENVLTGHHYTLKLEHQVAKKMSSRGAGPGESYGLDGQPSAGGGRAVGLNVMYALLSHGAHANLKEMYGFKGDRDFEAWRSIENGTYMPAPKVPASATKFVTMLRGMGVNLDEDDKGVVKMTPFLDKDVAAVSNGEVKDAKALRAKDIKEESGGIFDLRVTGGIAGDRWSHIELAEPVPHPTFEDAILTTTHLKRSEFNAIMKGEKGVLGGEVVPGGTAGAKIGGPGIKSILSKIDVDKRIEEIAKESKGARGAKLNRLHKEARTLMNFRDQGVKLEDMVVSKMPIIPPSMRPVFDMPGGDLHVSDINEHYREVILANNQLKELKKRPGLKDQADSMREKLYKGLDGVSGFSQGLAANPDVKGFASTIAGSTPKRGYFQRKLLRRRQENSGTGVVEPDPKLSMDELGIPEEMAWDIFGTFGRKELISSGMTPLAARKEWEDRTDRAREALDRSMESRHVLSNRAPTLHKFSIMAFRPKLVSGYAIKVPVEVLGGFNMDFDGDTVGVHVPTTDEANREAEKMLPSNNAYAPGSKRKSLMPSLTREFALGVYKLTRLGKTTAKSYINPQAAIRDAEARKIKWTDIIRVRIDGKNERTTAGKVIVNMGLPKDVRDFQKTFDKKSIEQVLRKLEKKDPKSFRAATDHFKHLGRKYAYLSGASFILSDLKVLDAKRRQLYLAADRLADKVRMDKKLSEDEKDKKIIEIYSKVDSKVVGALGTMGKNSGGETNNLADMIASGYSKPGVHQLKQMVGSVGLMLDHNQKVMPTPVRGNYSEGLSSSEFFQHMYAQRKGMIDKSQSVSGPGALTKQLSNPAAKTKVTMIDCGTRMGRKEKVDQHILDRVLNENVAGQSRGTVIDDGVLSKLKAQGQVLVRSPLSCEATGGVCAKCFGYDETGNFPSIGKMIGLSETQAITERSIQLPMKAFHSGGVATADSGLASAFDRAVDILNMPDNVKGKATLATISGRVGIVKKTGLGGHVVTIAGKQHRVGEKLEVLVKVGDMVSKGDKISSGIVKPQELLKLKGMAAVQRQVRDDLHDTYASAGVRLDRRTFEMPVKLLTEMCRVTDPGDSDYITGDWDTRQKIVAWNKSNPVKRPVRFVEELPGANQVPHKTTDWAQRMGIGYIKRTLKEGVAMGYESDRKESPFSGLALGPGSRIEKAKRK